MRTSRLTYLVLLIVCLCGAQPVLAGSCVDHPWYHQAPFEEFWALMKHEIASDAYRIVTGEEHLSRAGALLHSKETVALSEHQARKLVNDLPSVDGTKRLYLVRGIRYPIPGGNFRLYARGGHLLVSFSYLGPAEVLEVEKAPVLVALQVRPTKVFVSCGGAS